MPEPPADAPPLLRSIDSRHPVQVTFCNRSPRLVVPVWINFNGGRTDYRVIPAGRGLRMDTYLRESGGKRGVQGSQTAGISACSTTVAGHLWLFRDANTEDGLLANKKEWFLLFQAEGQQQPIRVDITLPGVPDKTTIPTDPCKMIKNIPGSFHSNRRYFSGPVS
ncbi:von Hippel-Lindau disease tumor suppressor isoform X3 [Pleurodeles waltl]|uniref:von Hippel-Lindau disease tumor suppressor isoform X3 n=1 Tax=Pleurodeles waltl TaxID=8319 RepID=UPI0037096751